MTSSGVISTLLEMREDVNEKPRYREITHQPQGAVDKKRRPRMCDSGDGEQATWTGLRRPRARIMVRPFAFCDGCWKRERLR